jgi:hypothetical protein
MVTLGMIAVGAIVGYDSAMAGKLVDIVIETLKEQEPLYNPDAASIAQLKSIFALALPLVQGALWVFLLFLAYYVATFIVRVSGKGLRPREDMPSSLRMPRNAIFLFLAGLVLAGFASLHFRTRGKPWRPLALWFAYASVLLFTLPIFAILVLGLSDTRRSIALTPAGPAGKDNRNT